MSEAKYKKCVGKVLPDALKKLVESCSKITGFTNKVDMYNDFMNLGHREDYHVNVDASTGFSTTGASISIHKNSKTKYLYIHIGARVRVDKERGEISDKEDRELSARIKSEFSKVRSTVRKEMDNILKNLEKEFSISIKPDRTDDSIRGGSIIVGDGILLKRTVHCKYEDAQVANVKEKIEARLENKASIKDENFYSDMLSDVHKELKKIFGATKVKEGKFLAFKDEGLKTYVITTGFNVKDSNKVMKLINKHGIREVEFNAGAKGEMHVVVHFDLAD